MATGFKIGLTFYLIDFADSKSLIYFFVMAGDE
jgi:hypothetical protein